MAHDIKFDFDRFDGRPGEPYREWRIALLNFCSSRSDESGSSWADHLLDVDMGGAGQGSPAVPTGPQGIKMIRLRLARAKNSYGIIVKHISDTDLVKILSVNFFGNGQGAFNYLNGLYDTPVRRQDLRELDRKWMEANIVDDVGINEDSIMHFTKLLSRMNGERPAGNRHNYDEMTEKLLECIADASRHFHELAMTEYNALPGTRKFEIPAGQLGAGSRDFLACVEHYHRLWKSSVRSKVLTPMLPQRRADATSGSKVDTFDANVVKSSKGAHHLPSHYQQPALPSHTLYVLRQAGLELERGTYTTTNFEEYSADEVAMAVDGEQVDGFDLESCYDADDRRSIDIICDCCRGVGHIRRQCPSPKQYRSFGYVIRLLEQARARAEQRAKRINDPVGGRRPPPRGQRSPFRGQPSRRQPLPKSVKCVSGIDGDSGEGESGDELKQAPEHVVQTAVGPRVVHCMPTELEDFFEDELVARSVLKETETETETLRVVSVAAAEPARARNRSMDEYFLKFLVFPFIWMAWITKHVWTASTVTVLAILSVWLIDRSEGFEIHTVHFSSGPMVKVGGSGQSGRVLRLCVDSGATSGCISKSCLDLIKVTNPTPKARVKVASGSILPVVAIGDLTITDLSGFVCESDGTRTPTTTSGTWHNMLVVDGLDPNTVLVSVRQMRDLDGIHTYFNNDNGANVNDCLKFPNGVYVPFSSDRFELTGTALTQTSNNCLHTSHLQRSTLHVHTGLCHAGAQRIQLSNIHVDGQKVHFSSSTISCKGCRLGGTKNSHRVGSSRRRAAQPSETPLTFFGQEVYSDTCSSFPRSFPHGFTGMVNFCDKFSGERDFFFLVRPHDPEEIASALTEYHRKNQQRLRGGRIWTWHTDNGGEFRGDVIDGMGGIARELVERRTYSVPNAKNCNPEAERAWGVIQRGIRTSHAHAEAPHCLWPWAAMQCSLVYHHLASTVHDPPKSVRDFLNPHLPPADLSWARTLFCDVLVALPERDVYNKVCHRTTMGCHLGYDERRRGHHVYCPKERRLGTYKVLKWMEDEFTCCRGISCDTPVEYHTVDDLQMSPSTSALIPKFFRRGTDSALRLMGPTSTEVASLLIGLGTYRLKHEAECLSDQGLKWISEHVPTEIVYAVSGTASSKLNFPTTVQDAKKTPYWPLVKEALEEEIRGKFLDNKAWDVVPRPTDRKVVKSKWVLKFYQNDDGSIGRVKARLVACGYSQVQGIDYTEVFAATLSAGNFRIFCSLVAALDWETDQLDAVKAFTQSDVDAEIYVEMPEGFAVDGHVLKLNKALEGIKQGAHLWFKRNCSALTSVGFVASLTEPNLYIHGEHPIMVAVFVDDIIVGFDRSARDVYTHIKQEYAKIIKIGSNAINAVHKFTGVEIARDRTKRTLTLTQRHYIIELGSRYQGRAVESCSPTGPLRKSIEEFDRLKLGTEDATDKVGTTGYMQLIGSLLWVANMTRPDIAYHCSRLAMYSSCPTKRHEYFGLCVLGYLLKTKDLGITYGGQLRVPVGMEDYPDGFLDSLGLHTYHDSSWGKDVQPFGGFVVMLNNGAVQYAARKVRIIPDSTAEAETAIASRAAKDTVGVRMVLADLRCEVRSATPLIGDCQATRDIITKAGSTQRTKYFERATLLVKRLFMLHVVTPILVRTDDMIADIFTKAIPRDKLVRCRQYMLNHTDSEGPTGALSAKARRIWKQLRAL